MKKYGCVQNLRKFGDQKYFSPNFSKAYSFLAISRKIFKIFKNWLQISIQHEKILLYTKFEKVWRQKLFFRKIFPGLYIALAIFWSKPTFVSELSHFLPSVVFFHAELKSALRFCLSLLVFAGQPLNGILLISNFRTSYYSFQYFLAQYFSTS